MLKTGELTMSLINKIITQANKIANKYPFILNSIKKILKLCPYLEEKICKTIDSENVKEMTDKTDKKILLSKTGQEIFDEITSPKFEKKSELNIIKNLKKQSEKIDILFSSIDNLFLNKKINRENIYNELSNIIHKDYQEDILKFIAQRTAEYLYPQRENIIYLDYSELAKVDAKTGIQRVSKNILKLLPKISKRQCIPIYSDKKTYGFKHYTTLANDKLQNDEETIEFILGDIIFFPELSIEQTIDKEEYLIFLKQKGVKIIHFIYDLIPILYPETCHNGMVELFPKYLSSLLNYDDGAICDSKAVTNDLKEYIRKNKPNRIDDFKIEWIHLGSDFENTPNSMGISDNSEIVFKSIESRITFLAVSTIEPRKMYDQILEAFNILWDNNQDINLVIVGKNGWNTEKLVKKIEKHKEINKRLFKLSGISDEYLNKIYDKSSVLIMASKAEGFGLGIIEATYHKKPLIIRDIPVFREIAGENAFYFNGFEGKDLANAIQEWIPLYKENKHPKSDNIKYLTWEESIQMLNEKLEKIYST